MTKTPYRVGPDANLALYPRGTKPGDVVHLTEGEALYERDMGRLTALADADGNPIAGEAKGYPADAVTGRAVDLTDEERARIQAGPDIAPDGGSEAASLGYAGSAPTEGSEASITASVPFMITAAMRERLRAHGKTDDEIAHLTPADAHALLADDGAPPAAAETGPATDPAEADPAAAKPRRGR